MLKRSRPIKKRKISSKNKCWKVFSEFIRRKYADENGMAECFTCGTQKHWKQLHAGHYIPKSLGLSILFEERNVHPQCAGCNMFRHGHLSAYAIALKKKYGDTVLEELDVIRRQIRKISEPEYVELIEHYKSALEQMQSEAG